METETAANPADEAIAAPAAISETEATTEVVETEDLDDLVKLGLGGDEEPVEAKLIDFEIDGKIVKISEDAKDYLLRQADYTKKTTEVAREREAIQAEKAKIEELRTIQTAVVNSQAELRALDKQIEQLANTPIDGLPQEHVNALQSRLLQLQAERQQVSIDVEEIARIENQKLSEEYGKQREEALAEAAKRIPNFTDKRRAELESLAVDLGIPKEDVEATADPAAYQILHLADIGKRFLESQSKARRVEDAPAPATEVGGRASATKDPDKMSTEEWVKWRQRQITR